VAGEDKDDRTEAPSARRLQKAREEGQVPQSRELQILVSLGFGVLALAAVVPGQAMRFSAGMRGMIENVGRYDLSAGGLQVVLHALALGVGIAGPIIAAASIGAIGITLLQTGFLLRPAALMPQLDRISPMRGIKRVLGVNNVIELLKAMVKLAIFAAILMHLFRGLWPVLPGGVQWDAASLGSRSTALLLRGALSVLAAQAAIAVFDVGWSRYRLLQDLRMSRQDLRDEHKDTEGDPHVKGRLRQLRRQRARQRMMQAVPKATVVITNPTHYAVALAYESGGKGAPRVVAKGVDEMAARIRAAAQDNKVPLVANPPLARALYTVPLDAEIPREHFQVVAGIIAYVWRLRRPAPGPAPVR